MILFRENKNFKEEAMSYDFTPESDRRRIQVSSYHYGSSCDSFTLKPVISYTDKAFKLELFPVLFNFTIGFMFAVRISV